MSWLCIFKLHMYTNNQIPGVVLKNRIANNLLKRTWLTKNNNSSKLVNARRYVEAVLIFIKITISSCIPIGSSNNSNQNNFTEIQIQTVI